MNINLNRFQDTPLTSDNRKIGKDTTNIEMFGSIDVVRKSKSKMNRVGSERKLYDEGEMIMRQKEIIQKSLDDPNIREELTFDSDADEGGRLNTAPRTEERHTTIEDEETLKRTRDIGDMLVRVAHRLAQCGEFVKTNGQYGESTGSEFETNREETAFIKS